MKQRDNRHRGHSLCGTPCWDNGPSKHSDSRLTAVIAVDSVKGVISRMLYEKETTGDKFTVFWQHLLLPAIQGTGTRVITMDKGASTNDVTLIICMYGSC